MTSTILKITYSNFLLAMGEVAADGVSKTRFIGPIVISLKTELAGSQEDRYVWCGHLIRLAEIRKAIFAGCSR